MPDEKITIICDYQLQESRQRWRTALNLLVDKDILAKMGAKQIGVDDLPAVIFRHGN